ncbi:MAG: hypothetical protein AB8F65_10010 [Woeseiaceae bacterium]
MTHPALDDSMEIPASTASSAVRRFWLPKVVYECVPYFYILAGFAALFATLYINAWYWMVPHWVLFTALCLHAGTSILVKRFRYRQRNSH